MILNLITRKSFWMRTTTIETQAKEKVAGRIDLSDFLIRMSQTWQMTVEDNKVIIEYIICMDEYGPFGSEIQLGWF